MFWLGEKDWGLCRMFLKCCTGEGSVLRNQLLQVLLVGQLYPIVDRSDVNKVYARDELYSGPDIYGWTATVVFICLWYLPSAMQSTICSNGLTITSCTMPAK